MVYLDFAATGLLYPEVLDAMREAELSYIRNPSSLHKAGYAAKRALDNAREKILSLLGVGSSHNLIFTSCATESNNAFLKGVAFRYQNRGKKILTSAAEHPSVINALKALIPFGFEVVELPLGERGYVEPKTLQEAMDSNVVLVSIIGVNNETGAISPLKDYSSIIKAFPKAIFHSDLTQAIGKLHLDFSCLDAFSFSAHKFGGPVGVGGLVMKKSLSPLPLLDGGAQENGLRAGTSNVAGAIAMANALELSYADMKANTKKIEDLQAKLKAGLLTLGEDDWNSPEGSSPFVFNFSLKHHKASVFVEALSNLDIYVSSVSACSSKKEPVSHVLLAMGKTNEQAANSIRVSLGYQSKESDVDAFLNALEKLLKEVHPR